MNIHEVYKEIKALPKDELYDLLCEYDNYVAEVCDENGKRGLPVCLPEFYDNDYQEILSERQGLIEDEYNHADRLYDERANQFDEKGDR